ncbi:MAG: NAD-dependent epimerase/dehydratase family protein [Acidobacteria bacterium]|nr:MAG: NAD-dependent epimerase/dehydratase family protein [Acidobacteriota bacterium]
MPVNPPEPDEPILLAGAETLAGRAVAVELAERGYRRIVRLSCDEIAPLRAQEIDRLVERTRPRWIFVAAGRSGGIAMNRERPASLMLGTLAAATTVIESAARHGCGRLLFFASSCCYPRSHPEPMGPELFGTGDLEPTSRPYAIARIAAAELCRSLRQERGCDFVVAVPSHPFGGGAEGNPRQAHVVPALLARFHDARRAGASRVVLWGTGRPRRDFIYWRDLGSAALTVMERYPGGGPVNLGCGMDVSIRELAREVASVVGYRGEIAFDPSHPDGAPVKLLDATELFELGWRPRWNLRRALEEAYRELAARRKEVPEAPQPA